MDCTDLDAFVEALVDGEALAPEVEVHLASCAACRARVDHARALDQLLRAREIPEPSARFTIEVLRRVRGERWRAEQFVDAGFNVAVAVGVLVILAGATGLLLSLGWLSVDLAAIGPAAAAVAPWTARLMSDAQTLAIAAVLLSSVLVLWWWVESGEETL